MNVAFWVFIVLWGRHSSKINNNTRLSLSSFSLVVVCARLKILTYIYYLFPLFSTDFDFLFTDFHLREVSNNYYNFILFFEKKIVDVIIEMKHRRSFENINYIFFLQYTHKVPLKRDYILICRWIFSRHACIYLSLWRITN